MKLFFVIVFFVFHGLLVFAQPSAKHDLVFAQLAKNWDEAIPLGNGLLGALVWQKDSRLHFSLDRSDLWDERPMKGLHRPEFSYWWVYEQVKKRDYKIVQQYFDAPYDAEAAPTKIGGGALEINSEKWGPVKSVRLFLKTALCEVQWKSGVVLKTFVHATKPLGWFRLENLSAAFDIELITPKYQRGPADTGKVKSNDVSRLGYPQGTVVRKGNRITYHQKGWDGFWYEIAVQWKKIDGKTIEGSWTVISSNASKQSKTFAAEKATPGATFSADFSTHTKWWTAYWQQSSLHVPDTLLENQWYRDQYKFGSCTRRGAPPILLQGVWTADNGRLPPWKGDYHHDLNTELSYWPAYSGNHLNEAMAFIDHLEQNKTNYKRYTKLYFKTDGLAVPGVTTLNGTEMGGWIQYALSPTVSGWLAHHYYLQWKYSGDQIFLKQKAYPWLKETAKHLEELSKVNEDGKRQLPISSSPEINNNNLEAWFLNTTNYDLALMRFVFRTAAEMAHQLNLSSEEKHWRQLENQLPPFAISEQDELMYVPGFPYIESHRHFSNAMAIHPLGLIKWEDGAKEQSIIKHTLHLIDSIGPANWNGYSYAWLASLKARAKDGEGAAKALEVFAKAFCSINSFHVNGDQTSSGYSKRTYRPFTLEGNFAAASGLQEMLLQSYAGFIEIMPAIPDRWSDADFHNLRAEGAYLVSAVKKNGAIYSVQIVAEKGGSVRLKLPVEKWKAVQKKGARIEAKEAGFLQLDFEKGGSIQLQSGRD